MSKQPLLRVISSSHPQIPIGPSDLFDLLGASCDDVGGYRILFQAERKKAFFIWVCKAFEASPWTFDDGIAHAEHFLQLREAYSTTFLCTINQNTDDKTVGKTNMVSILSLQSEAAQSVSIPFHDRQALEESSWTTGSSLGKGRGFLRRNVSFLIVAFILVLMSVALAAISTLRHHPSSDLDLWMHWNTTNSEGPNQLQYTYPHPNFTTWAAETHHDSEDWFIRVDDQSMIPARLVDYDERRYQEWFRSRYPNFEAVRASGDYLNETFYRHATHHELEIDHDFHITHCILVMKRYWHARETGKHVCPRDLDYGHINHCFDVLEQMAIVDLPGTKPMTEQTNGTRISWIVNACF